jgi:hypothetical protein
MSIESLIKLFEQYGWPGVVAIIAILVVYYFVSKKDKNSLDTIKTGFSSLTTTITHQNETLIDAITSSNEKTQERLFTLISKSLDENDNKKKQYHKASLSKRVEVSELVDDVLFEILQMTNSQRVVLIEFHNSKENLDGLSYLWYDIQHEKQARGIESISAKCRNLQATNLRPIIKRVNNSKNHIAILDEHDIEDIYNESTVLYSHFKEINTTHLIYMGLYNDVTNELIGIVAIEWQSSFPYHDDLIDLFALKEKAGLIEHYYNQARHDMEELRQQHRQD